MSGPAIPVVVVGGYLGAGKTTLVNHLLRSGDGRRIAVLVNDFGDIGIDADLIEGSDGEVVNLAGGCICCSFGDDLASTLAGLLDREAPPDAVLLEVSGVGVPDAVARSVGLVAGLRVEGVIVLADAETVRSRAAERYVGETVRQQLRAADLLVLNKIDLVSEAEQEGTRAWLDDLAPGVPIVAVRDATLPVGLVFGGDLAAGAANGESERHRHDLPSADTLFETGERRFSGPTDIAALVAEITQPASRIVRAKGVLTDLNGSRRLVQLVGRRVSVTAWTSDRASGPPVDALVWIAVRGAGD